MKKLLIVLATFAWSTSLFAQGSLAKDYRIKIESIMAPLRLKVENSLKKENAALFTSYQTDLKKLAAIADPKKQELEMEQFAKNYYTFVKAGYNKANIDEAGAKKSLNQLLSGFKYKITYGEFLSITGFYTLPSDSTTAGGCVELKCPMDVRNTTMSINNLAPIGGTATGDCFAISNSSSLYVLNREDLSAAGKRTTIARDMARVDLSCPLTYYLSGTAIAIIGGSYCDASVGLKITGRSVDTRIEFVSGWALAPIIWYNAFKKTGQNNFMECSFTPSLVESDYTIQGFAKTFTVAGVFAGTIATARIRDFSPIKVCQVKK